MIDFDDLDDLWGGAPLWCGVHDCRDPSCDRDVLYDERRREVRHVETVQAVVGL